jgi:hypothetical protein
MEILGFAFMTLTLIGFTCGWCFLLIADGALGGKREIPIPIMVAILILILCGWSSLIDASPFIISLA